MKDTMGKILDGLSRVEELELLEHLKIDESSLSHIWQHIEEDKRSFGVVSAFRGGYKRKDNEGRQNSLKADVRDKGYGHIEMDGGYVETGKEGGLRVVNELSLFIPEVKYKDLLEFGKSFDQEVVIYKDAKSFVLVTPAGKIETNYLKSGGGRHIALDKESIKDYFSALLKGSHRGKKFVFIEADEGLDDSYDAYFFIREHKSKSVLSHYYTKGKPQRFLIYKEGVVVEEEDGRMLNV